jgi:hypothetical protein
MAELSTANSLLTFTWRFRCDIRLRLALSSPYGEIADCLLTLVELTMKTWAPFCVL